MNKSYISVAFVKYPAVQLAAVHGLTDMLKTANEFTRELSRKSESFFCITHCNFDENSQQLGSEWCTLNPAPSQHNILVVPGSLERKRISGLNPIVLDWIRGQHEGGAIASSICKGAFILAQSGILNNRTVTTHWACKDEFSAEFPDIHLEIDKLIVDDGDIITAGGVMAWLDLGLHLIHRYAGAEVMIAVSKYLLIDLSQREQKYYQSFSPPFDHGDKLVVKTQHWLQTNFGEPLSLAKLAEMAATSVRTLIRRFDAALGMSPTTYIQQLRIGKARELLEFSTLPVSQIAWKVGYEDPSSFRRVFQRFLGLSPTEYRRRFRAENIEVNH